MFTDKKIIFLTGYDDCKEVFLNKIISFIEERGLKYYDLNLDYNRKINAEIKHDKEIANLREVLIIKESIYNSSRRYDGKSAIVYFYKLFKDDFNIIIICGTNTDYTEVREDNKNILKIQCLSRNDRKTFYKLYSCRIGMSEYGLDDFDGYLLNSERKMKIKKIV